MDWENYTVTPTPSSLPVTLSVNWEQGQGLGRYLLQHALQEMHKVGYRHAAISSGLDNHRAFLFYNNCGYRTVDWTYQYDKVLSGT